MKTDNFVTSGYIRSDFVEKLIPRFGENMPLFKEMLEVVAATNAMELKKYPEKRAYIEALGKIMHGAVRIAKQSELFHFRQIMAIMGCTPHNFYDLRRGVSVGATGMRPSTTEQLNINGFRVFTSFFDINQIKDSEDKAFVEGIIAERNVFTGPLFILLDEFEEQGGFTQQQSDDFVEEILNLFIRPKHAAITLKQYHRLLEINKTAAHMLVSNAFALNHLTPCVANVHEAHREMQRRGIKTIPVVQGPPEDLPVLLNQTSCLAPPITLLFPTEDGNGYEEGEHQESFVEMEQRHIALTQKGRALYDEMLQATEDMVDVPSNHVDYPAKYHAAQKVCFADFPRNHDEMRRQGLAYFTYEFTELFDQAKINDDVRSMSLDELVDSGLVKAIPQLYEDFLPKSAQGIFRANMGQDRIGTGDVYNDGQEALELSMSAKVIDMYSEFYEPARDTSIREIELVLAA